MKALRRRYGAPSRRPGRYGACDLYFVVLVADLSVVHVIDVVCPRLPLSALFLFVITLLSLPVRARRPKHAPIAEAVAVDSAFCPWPSLEVRESPIARHGPCQLTC